MNPMLEIKNGTLIKCYACGYKAVNIPNGIHSIGEKAFFCMDAIRNVVIPDSVTTIGGGAFEFCGSLTNVEFKSPTGWDTTCDLRSSSEAATILKTGKALLKK